MSYSRALAGIVLALLVATAPHLASDPQLSRPGTGSIDGGEVTDSAGPAVTRSVEGDHPPRRAPSLPARTNSPPTETTENGCPLGDPCVEFDTGETATVQSQPRDRTPYGIETVYDNPSITRTTGGRGVDVAVLDTGVAMDHPDLRRRLDLCRDYTVEPVRDGSCADDNGHGTHVAGTVLADGGPNGNGIYGVAPEADLYAFKVCTADRNCTSTRVSAAIRDAADAGAEIIVLSLGGQRTQHVQSAVQYAHDEGVLVVASAGNNGPDLETMNWPGADELVVSVGAVERTGSGETIEPEDFRVPDFSSRGRDEREFREADGYLEVVAPGVDVLSTWPGGYASRSGTSVAVPHVAGLAAKLWPLTRDRNGDGHRNDDVRRVLQRRAPGFDVTAGVHARRGYDPAAGLGLPQVEQPRAQFTHTPATPTEGQSVRLSAEGSTSPDSTIVRYEWDFDADGTVDASGRTVSVVFVTPGPRTVRLRVIDADGATDSETRTIQVNARPAAVFSVSPPVAVQGEATRFDASESVDPDGRLVSYEWDFDDDGVVDARGPFATYTFTASGVHTVRLRVTDDTGAAATTTTQVRVTAPPVAAMSYDPTVPEQGVPVEFDASASTDPDGSILAYEWDFDGDGSTDARGEVVSHAFEAFGSQAVTLRVVDDDGATNTTTRSVLVNDRPTVTYTGPVEASAGTPVTLTATITDEVGATTVTWEFPDGTSATGTSVTRAFEPGQQVIPVVAEDEYGARSTQEVTLSVRAAPGTTATPPAETTRPPRTGTGTTTRPGPGFGVTAVIVALGILTLVAMRRRFLLRK